MPGILLMQIWIDYNKFLMKVRTVYDSILEHKNLKHSGGLCPLVQYSVAGPVSKISIHVNHGVSCTFGLISTLRESFK